MTKVDRLTNWIWSLPLLFPWESALSKDFVFFDHSVVAWSIKLRRACSNSRLVGVTIVPNRAATDGSLSASVRTWVLAHAARDFLHVDWSRSIRCLLNIEGNFLAHIIEACITVRHSCLLVGGLALIKSWMICNWVAASLPYISLWLVVSVSMACWCSKCLLFLIRPKHFKV